MTEKDARRDWGLCRQTYNLLCTLTRMGLKFSCPMEKVIQMQISNEEVKSVEAAVYRRRRR